MKRLIITSLEHEIGARRPQTTGNAIRFPLIPSRKAAVYELKPEDINDILLREEVAAYEAAGR